MMIVLFFIVLFIFFIFVELGLSVGLAYILIWLLPNISFEMGVVIGAICVNFTLLFFMMLMMFSTEREKYNLDRSFFLDAGYEEDLEEDTEYHNMPTPQPRNKKRQKRKR